MATAAVEERRAARRDLARRRARRARARARRGCTCRVPTGICRARRSARWSRRSWSCCSAWASRPARTRCSYARRSSSRTRRDACQPEVEGAANPARELARKIGRTIPLIYGGGALGAVAAYRWKCDVNENAKAPAFWHAYPGARPQRDLRVGPARRRDPPAAHARRAAPRLRARAARASASTITREIIDEACTRCSRSRREGEGRLAQLLDLMYLGDWVSLLPRARERRRSRPDRRDLRAEAPPRDVTHPHTNLERTGA